METEANSLYRKLPQLGEVLDSPGAAKLASLYSRDLIADAARAVLARMRQQVKAGECDEASLELALRGLFEAIERELAMRLKPSLCRVINATGVILQTNLGRAPLSRAAIERIGEIAGGYCNLEMDLQTGDRGWRDVHVESLLLNLLALRSGEPIGSLQGRRAVAVVNNCAAATLLALNTMAEGGEVIVSRGELVEIGGGFRIPEILQKSGAVLREVGTTNRTRIADYAAAMTAQTRLILRVHRSNFRIEGFTQQPRLQELIELGARHSVPVFEDQGTGCLVSLDEYGMRDESSWLESATSGAALISASGDKLLGGPQCGILVGDCGLIDRVRANALFRALRVDKLTYAALDATLFAYLSGADSSIPAIAMLAMSAGDLRRRCELYVEALQSDQVAAEVVPVSSLVGGGTTPDATLPGFGVALMHAEMTENAVAALLRRLEPPIVALTREGRVLLDLRTVLQDEDADAIRVLRDALNGPVSPTSAGG